MVLTIVGEGRFGGAEGHPTDGVNMENSEAFVSSFRSDAPVRPR
jgi:hypothetical protein